MSLLDLIESQYIGAISVPLFVCFYVSAHIFRTRYNQIVLTSLYVSPPLHSKDNKDDQDNQDDQHDQYDQYDHDDQDVERQKIFS